MPFDELAVLEVTRFDAKAAVIATAAAVLTVSAFAVVTGQVAVMPATTPAP